MGKQATTTPSKPMASDWNAIHIIKDVEGVRQERIKKQRLEEYRKRRSLFFEQRQASFDLQIERVA